MGESDPILTPIPVSQWKFHFKKHAIQRFAARVHWMLDDPPVTHAEFVTYMEKFTHAPSALCTAIAKSCPTHPRNEYMYLCRRMNHIVTVAVCEIKHHKTEKASRVDCVVKTFLTFKVHERVEYTPFRRLNGANTSSGE